MAAPAGYRGYPCRLSWLPLQAIVRDDLAPRMAWCPSSLGPQNPATLDPELNPEPNPEPNSNLLTLNLHLNLTLFLMTAHYNFDSDSNLDPDPDLTLTMDLGLAAQV